MWFVLEMGTEKTVAMTPYADAAKIIADTFPAKCILRYAAEIQSGYDKKAKFFETMAEVKGA